MEVNDQLPLKRMRHSIIHGNFFSPESIKKMRGIGIYADLQPAWYYKDADLMHKVLGDSRMKSFHPYRSMIDAGIMLNAGSDHMVKLDSYKAINPYNPFLSIWSMITRKTARGTVYYAQESIGREEALKSFTINNAYASFEEEFKGCIEIGKAADLAVLSKDILTCPTDSIRNTQVFMTIVDGEIVYSSNDLHVE
jgi:predicted amidohydrolase YtcJ